MSFFRLHTRDDPPDTLLTGPRMVHLEKRYRKTVEPAVEVVTLAEQKKFMTVEEDLDDALIDDLIVTAREAAEDWTKTAFITQTYELSMDNTPREVDYDIAFPPLQSVEKIESFKDDNTSQTFTNTLYFVDLSRDRMPGRVVLNQGNVWPTDLRSRANFLTTFKAGYGDASSDVPKQIKTALMLQTKIWYEESKECGDCECCLSKSVKVRLMNYRVPTGLC